MTAMQTEQKRLLALALLLRDQAAEALDATHGDPGIETKLSRPRTLKARSRLALWLDTGDGTVRNVKADIAWLRTAPPR